MTDGDESHSEFSFAGFVLAGSFPACIGVIGFVIILKSAVPHTGGHRASHILYNDASQSFMLTPLYEGPNFVVLYQNQ